ncbi:hypothetical protein BKP35_10155 [Anaerobacillus arseniciselenatis]|uniref:DUF4097 domain-containing protein n=1 Tax=Anaerobacillus arseniciselenatis TaxID=85682 RepID=A0A1S2LMK7_9BACI|nr:DUF4097 family beta strand repeat-containing protein [Anaerobacillus arseniciselenatis]OIJ12917.1 hypothetical protein BKP35_10155 [Anaerobacillus arseniciselenatis]
MNRAAFLGIALIAIGIFALVFNFNQPVFSTFTSSTIEINEKEVIDGKNIETIDVNVSSPSVYLIPTDSNEITVELIGEISEKTDFEFDVTSRNNKLDVYVKNSTTVSGWFNFSTMTTNLQLELHIPRKEYNKLNVHSSSGRITLNDLHAKNVELRASSGRIEISNVTAESEINLQTSSGRIEAVNNTAKSLQARASSGRILINGQISEQISPSTSSGSIVLENFEGDVSAAASSGRVSIINDQLVGDINVSTSSGRVEIDLKNAPTSALIDFQGSSGRGSVNLPGLDFEEKSNNRVYGTIGAGKYEIKVRTSSGRFELN